MEGYLSTLPMPSGKRYNIKQQWQRAHTDTQVYFVIYISNWDNLSHWKGKSAHERFFIFNISCHLLYCGGIRYPPRFPLHTQSSFFHSLSPTQVYFSVVLSGQLGFVVSNGLIGTLCALLSSKALQIQFSCPSKPPKVNFRGVTPIALFLKNFPHIRVCL